jgi:hypothetical protein
MRKEPLPQARAEPEEESPSFAATVEEPKKERTPQVDWAGLLYSAAPEAVVGVFACSRCGGGLPPIYEPHHRASSVSLGWWSSNALNAVFSSNPISPQQVGILARCAWDIRRQYQGSHSSDLAPASKTFGVTSFIGLAINRTADIQPTRRQASDRHCAPTRAVLQDTKARQAPTRR